MKRFSVVQNGYDIDEVNRFIDIVIARLEKLNTENVTYVAKIEKFNIIAKNIKVEKRISNIDLEGFCVEVRKKPYQKAIELKNWLKKKLI